jgi:hypothetical protein
MKYCIAPVMFLIFFIVAEPSVAQSQKCISGDCKNGFGVLLKDSYGREYQIGQFNKKGVLNGEGAKLKWIGENTLNESNFLNNVASITLDFQKLKDYAPYLFEMGNYKNGLLDGKGISILHNQKKLSKYYAPPNFLGLDWLIFFNDKNFETIKYEGDYLANTPTGKGMLTCVYDKYEFYDTLKFVAENLLLEKNKFTATELIIEVKSPKKADNELIRANIYYNKFHGWALSAKRDTITGRDIFFRQLWCNGKMIHEDNGGAYPFDIDNTQLIKDENGYEISGPLQNGKVNGFGTIKYSNNHRYQGYIFNNQPEGFGIMDTVGSKKYGLFNNGYIVQGIWLQKWNLSLTVYEGNYEGISGKFKDGYFKQKYFFNENDFFNDESPSQSYEGNFLQATGWQGKVISKTSKETKEIWYNKGVVISSKNAINNIELWQVYTKNNIASIVISYDASVGEGTLADGRKINPSNKHEYKPSKYIASHFFDACTCGGDAKTTKTKEVSGYTNSWSRTEQVNKSAVVGYWQGTQQVTSTYYTPGYSYQVKAACENANAIWAPYGIGTRHSILRTTFLKE